MEETNLTLDRMLELIDESIVEGSYFESKAETLKLMIRKAYAAGRLQGISEAEGVVPEGKSMIKSGDPLSALTEALGDKEFNNCRQQMLDNIAKLKEGK